MNKVRPIRSWEKDVEDWIGQVSGELDEQQKICWCIEDLPNQQRPEMDERELIVHTHYQHTHLLYKAVASLCGCLSVLSHPFFDTDLGLTNIWHA